MVLLSILTAITDLLNEDIDQQPTDSVIFNFHIGGIIDSIDGDIL